MLTRCYTPPVWARKERDRLTKRMALPNDRPSRALAVTAGLGVVIAIALGFGIALL